LRSPASQEEAKRRGNAGLGVSYFWLMICDLIAKDEEDFVVEKRQGMDRIWVNYGAKKGNCI